MRRGENVLDEELICVDAFTHHLKLTIGHKNVAVQKPERDPPDFFVTIDDQTFPVEVTSVVDRVELSAHYNEFCEIVENHCLDEGVLNGVYAISFRRFPPIPKPSSSAGRALFKSACDFVCSTQLASSGVNAYLSSNRREGEIQISKLSTDNQMVSSIEIPGAKFQSEIVEDLTDLIEDAISRKTKSLSKVGFNQNQAVLLLYDAFGFGSSSDALNAMSRAKGKEWFHSIFWATSFASRQNESFPNQPGRTGTFIYSSNSNWMIR